MPPSELQKRILELSSRVVATDDSDEFGRLASELRKALREHATNLRTIIGETKDNIAKRSLGVLPHDRAWNKRVERETKIDEEGKGKQAVATHAAD